MSGHHFSPAAVSVLTAFRQVTVKTHYIDDAGLLKTQEYDNEKHFSCKVEAVSGIDSLAKLIEHLSSTNNKIIIRGQPKVLVKGHVRRTNEHYQEPPEGLSWAMLDFDKIPLPDGLSPTSVEAIEYVIAKLPEPFHQASYFYQFSSSTGIVRPDGTSLKRGLNVHLFFWFSRPITGAVLKAYLMGHCIQTQFLERCLNKAGQPMIRYGVDMALFNDVQPHYISAPIIKEGVICTLDPSQRQQLVTKRQPMVTVPEFNQALIPLVKAAHNRLFDAYKSSLGMVRVKSLTKSADGGIAVQHFYLNPNPAAVVTGRAMSAEPKLTEKQDRNDQTITYATLYFADEGSPGSWFVSSRNPCVAQRHGDYAQESLRELSEDAYCYVRDQLKWFSDVNAQTLSLVDGYLPPFTSFATARNSLILAPTGCGKTYAFCQFAITHRHDVIIYAAQTRALNRQMQQDLIAHDVSVTHYKDDFNPFDPVWPGVYVTTNESMNKIVKAVKDAGRDFILVIDEVHAALDDFMATNAKNELLENAIGRAKQTILMSGTITPLQLKQLTETISRATGELTPSNYGYYEFSPVKANPLWWPDLSDFGRDFVAMLRHYQGLKAAGQAIPRTVLIVPTSKMRRFEILLDAFGLCDDAEVVSSNEATQADLERARVSDKPILISSPVFSLGLTFDYAPARFWTSFQYLQVDTSQIVQTLNRANRTNGAGLSCEVRLYAGKLDPFPMMIPEAVAERLKIEEYFQNESGFPGLLDSHFQVGRVTYNQLRDSERDTAKSLYQLKSDDAVQNYRRVETWTDPLSATQDDANLYEWARAEAKAAYDQDVLRHVPGYTADPPALLTNQLATLKKKKRDFNDDNLLTKRIKDHEKAIVMALAKTQAVGVGNSSSPMRLSRLFGDADVFLSAQYHADKNPEWMKAAAEKTASLAVLLPALNALKLGQWNGVTFGKKMRLPGLRSGVLALVDHERDYVYWSDQVKALDELCAEHRGKAGAKRRKVIDGLIYDLAKEFLATIGVGFEKTKGADGRLRLDPDKPLVPDWDFDVMARTLLIKAESLKRRPAEPIDEVLEDLKWGEGPVSLALCQQCVHCTTSLLCRLGRPVESELLGLAAETDECDAFKKLPERLR